MKTSASFALHRLLVSKHKVKTRAVFKKQTTTLPTRLQLLNYFPRTYGVDANNSVTDDEIATFIQPPSKIPSKYTEGFAKTLRCEDVYEEQDFNDILIQELDTFIRQSLRRY